MGPGTFTATAVPEPVESVLAEHGRVAVRAACIQESRPQFPDLFRNPQFGGAHDEDYA